MNTETKIAKVAHKIDIEFISELYKRAKAEKGEKRRKLLERAFSLSKHLGKYLVINDINIGGVPPDKYYH